MTSPDRERGILAVDPGSKRYGVAFADLETRFARPLEVIDAEATDPVERVLELAASHGATEIVVGRPVGLSGNEGPAVRDREAFVSELKAKATVVVTEYDERLTTVIAEQGLRASGARARDRATVRDAVAAQVLLQSFLDSRR